MQQQPDDSNEAEVERPAAATAERPEGRSALTWTAAEILNSVEPNDKLRHIRTEWASRSELASALEIHVDTVHRRCLAAGVATRIEVTPARRCRVLYLVDDIRQKLRGAQ